MELGIIINQDRSVTYNNNIKGGNINENKVTNLTLSYPEELNNFNKIIEFETDDGKIFDVIFDDKYIFKNNITKYENVIAQIVFEDVETNKVWKSDIFELSFGESINAKYNIDEESNNHAVLDTIIVRITKMEEKIKEFVITVNKENNKYVCDKNWEEINEARKLGRKLTLLYESNCYYLSYSKKLPNNYLEFASLSAYGKKLNTFLLNEIEDNSDISEIDIQFNEIDLEIPSKLSELENDDFVVKDEKYVHTDNNFTNEKNEKLNNIEDNAQANIIENIKINNELQDIDNEKTINITIPTKLSELNNDDHTVKDENYKHIDVDSELNENSENVIQNAAVYKAIDEINTTLKAEGFGVGIVDIEKTKTEGLIDTYTISLSNGKTKEITVKNGEKGEKGDVKFCTFNVNFETGKLEMITDDDMSNLNFSLNRETGRLEVEING